MIIAKNTKTTTNAPNIVLDFNTPNQTPVLLINMTIIQFHQIVNVMDAVTQSSVQMKCTF